MDVDLPPTKKDEVYQAYDLIEKPKTDAELADENLSQIVDMYGKRADGSKRNKTRTIFDELWEKQHPKEAKAEKDEKEKLKQLKIQAEKKKKE